MHRVQTLLRLSDQQFTDKEIQIVTDAFKGTVAATNRL